MKTIPLRPRTQDVEDRTRPGARVTLFGKETLTVNDKTMRRHHYHYENESYGRPYEEGPEDNGYTQDDLDRMYRDALEGDSEDQWNID